MRALITGGTGLLGTALVETNKEAEIFSVYIGAYGMKSAGKAAYYKADICDERAMKEVFDKARPQIVIHTAGIANVDHCEKNYDEAYKANVIGTKAVLEFTKMAGAKMVFISTNAVFDGRSKFYSEASTPRPINNYGKMKLEAEGIVKESGVKHLIVRPLLMYGWNNENERPNTVTWLIEKLKKSERVNMVNDIYENPLFNITCAEVIWSLIGLCKEGLYHVAGKDVVNRYEFATIIADVFGLDRGLINQVSNDFFTGIAPRPCNTSYDTSKVEKELNMKIAGLKESLIEMKNRKRRAACQERR